LCCHRDDAVDAAQGLLQLLQARQGAQDALALQTSLGLGASLESLNGLQAALTGAAVAGATGDPLETLAFYQQGRESVQGFMHPLLQQHYAAAAAAVAAAGGRGRVGYGSLGLVDGDDGMSMSLSGAQQR
jgi:hypothetical protein